MEVYLNEDNYIKWKKKKSQKGKKTFGKDLPIFW